MLCIRFVLNIMFVLLPGLLAVKIGVSKINTKNTETVSPNISVNESEATDAFSYDMETSTAAIILNQTSTTTLPQFPPKITKSVKKTTTTVPATTSQKTTHNETTLNLTSSTNTTLTQITDELSVLPKKLYCSCDLLPSTCDTNCCCDLDCPMEILKVFDCFSPAKYPEFRLIMDNFQYEHGLPSCKINDGWLCVFRTNTRPVPKKVHRYNFDTKNKYKWTEPFIAVTEFISEKKRDFYKYGDLLKVINLDTEEIQNFEIPYDYVPPFCHLSEPIRHLMSMTRKCLVPMSFAAQELKRKYIDFVTTTNLVRKPQSYPTEFKNRKGLMKNVELKDCMQKTENEDVICTKLGTQNNETETSEFENYYVFEIRIKIFHNFTDLMGCEIELLEKELTLEIDIERWQQYSIEFIATNETDAPHILGNGKTKQLLSYSGPLGYLQGEPIIVAKYIANNEFEEQSAQNQVLNYFKNANAANNTLSLLTQRSGYCLPKYGKPYGINYGISTQTQCILRLEKTGFKQFSPKSFKKINFTAVCIGFQEQISKALFNMQKNFNLNELAELHVSVFGRPKNSTDKWLPLQVQNMNFVPMSYELNVQKQTITCRNVIISAAYEFHIGIFPENETPRQALVKNAVLKLGPRHDLEFSLDENLEVPLILTVMFYDVSLNVGSLIGNGITIIVCNLVLTALYYNFI